ncbi:hypothetical protein [Bacillus sp. FSL K6-3431]|uniref:hypothetical protein n=1 Tax=Bacillus sp. FSL K6-3431 TaxID=2921500 RepID=UPI0030F6ED92
MVNKPYLSRTGREIEICESELGTFFVVIFQFIEGELNEIDELAEMDFYQGGKSLGHLHKVAQHMTSKVTR